MGSYKSNYHTIMNMTDPNPKLEVFGENPSDEKFHLMK